jgi:tRNA (guanine37-N1)-methyltransferase
MKIDILTLFPEMFTAVTSSILGKAGEKGILDIRLTNIRDYTQDKHKRVDEYPFGGGVGMVMQADPIFRALEAVEAEGKRAIYMSPRGKILDQEMIEQLAEEKELVILCGHYEGVDQRVLDHWNMEEISIGDYVLTGGELPALVLADSISRMLPGVLPNEEAFSDESHYSSLLEHPQYTRPYEWHGQTVPDILLSGHHANICKWKRQQSLMRTYLRRPDMLSKADLDKKDIEFLRDFKSQLKEQSRQGTEKEKND